MNGNGSFSELSLCDSAAKCTVTSWLATSSSTTTGSHTEPTTRVNRSAGSPSSEAVLPA